MGSPPPSRPLWGLQLCPSLLDDVLGSARVKAVLIPSIFPFSLTGSGRVGGVFDGIFSLLSKGTPPGQHYQLIILLTARACLSSDPANSAAAC